MKKNSICFYKCNLFLYAINKVVTKTEERAMRKSKLYLTE